MKKLLLFFVAGFSLLTTTAQLSESDISVARQVVAKNSAAIGLSTEDLNNIIVSSKVRTIKQTISTGNICRECCY